MKQIQLVALDLDGTVIGSDLKLLPAVREAIAQTQERGVRVILSTGRMFSSSRPFAEALKITGPFITYNGALVMDLEGKLYDQQPVPKPLVLDVIEAAKAEGVTLNLYVNDRLCVAEMNEDVEYYNTIAQVEPRIVGDLSAFVRSLGDDEHVHKALLVAQPDVIGRLLPQFQARYDGRLEVVASQARFIEFTGHGVSKGKALASLCRQLDIAPEHVMAVGDNFNDVTMLQFAGLGVAMGNAPASVKAVADVSVGTVSEGGVAEAIRRFVIDR